MIASNRSLIKQPIYFVSHMSLRIRFYHKRFAARANILLSNKANDFLDQVMAMFLESKILLTNRDFCNHLRHVASEIVSGE